MENEPWQGPEQLVSKMAQDKNIDWHISTRSQPFHKQFFGAFLGSVLVFKRA